MPNTDIKRDTGALAAMGWNGVTADSQDRLPPAVALLPRVPRKGGATPSSSRFSRNGETPVNENSGNL